MLIQKVVYYYEIIFFRQTNASKNKGLKNKRQFARASCLKMDQEYTRVMETFVPIRETRGLGYV